MMENWIIKRFQQPDETRIFEKGKFEIIHIGNMTIGRAEYQPGWRWSEHVSPIAGTPLCQTDHIGLVLSGRAKLKMEDGSEVTLTPGDMFAIAPGHDSWVVGNDTYVSLHFLGAGEYATKDQKK
jgi:quercetin dioxygenase-like cupin family protein